MEEMSAQEQVCPRCGFQAAQYRPGNNALLPMTVLAGRYLIGRVLGAGGRLTGYAAGLPTKSTLLHLESR